MRNGGARSHPQDRDWSDRRDRPRRGPDRTPRRGGTRSRPAHRGGWRRFRSKSGFAQFGYVVATLGAVLFLVAGVTAYAYVQNLVGNIKVVQVGGLTKAPRYGPLNVLVLGSQQRAGQMGYKHGWFGIASGSNPYTSNSDNLLIVHLDATRTHATILSIPRDTMVYEPACKARSPQIGVGMQGPYPSSLIEGALNIGGPTCAVKTVEDFTGIKINDFVEFDFNSFREMVDALGGVEVCVPRGGYHDPAARINLGPGLHHLRWNEALAYVRQRHHLGGPDAGGDLPRILVQQAFISSVIQQVNSQGLLSNTGKLLRIASVATKALTVDQNLGNISALLHLARSLTHLHASHVSLITMPTGPAGVHLVPSWLQDDVIFQLIQDNKKWSGKHLPLLSPAKVKVQVLNGSGVTGLAGRTARQLRKLGYDVVGTGDAAATSTTTVSYSGTAQADEAWTLMNALHNTASLTAQNLLTEPTPQIGHFGTVTLTLGSDYANFTVLKPSALASVVSKKPGKSNSAGSVQTRNAGENICAGLPHQAAN
jgi:LCP family protein required for cell wall assembly